MPRWEWKQGKQFPILNEGQVCVRGTPPEHRGRCKEVLIARDFREEFYFPKGQVALSFFSTRLRRLLYDYSTALIYYPVVSHNVGR